MRPTINQTLALAFFLIFSHTSFAQLGRIQNDLVQGVKTELDSTLQGVKTEIKGEINGFKSEINDHLDEVKSEVDSTLNHVRTEVQATKGELIDAIGEVTWRFTLVEIIMSLLTTILTAYFTAHLTTKRLAINQFKGEIESILKESKDTIEELKKEIEGLKS